MIRQERGTYCCNDYFGDDIAVFGESNILNTVTEADRFKIVNWTYEVVDHCHFSRETVAIAIELLDRFLSTSSVHALETRLDRKRYQLVAMATLYLAIKLNERATFDSNLFSAMSRGVYSPEDIEETERIVLNVLNWRVCAPTSLQIAHHIIALLSQLTDVDHSVFTRLIDDAKLGTEHAVRDYFFVLQNPSTVAVASVLNAINKLDGYERDVLKEAASAITDEMHFSSQENIEATRLRLLHNMDMGDRSTDGVTSELVIRPRGAKSRTLEPTVPESPRAVTSDARYLQ